LPTAPYYQSSWLLKEKQMAQLLNVVVYKVKGQSQEQTLSTYDRDEVRQMRKDPNIEFVKVHIRTE
jgi:hypothetical protein